MAELLIPPHLRTGIQNLAGLDDEKFNQLIHALADAPPALQRSAVLAHVASQFTTIPRREVRNIVYAIIGIYSSVTSTKTDVSEFLTDLTGSADLDLEEADRAKLRERLEKLTNFPGLEITSKALNVFTEHEHLFRDVRVITDIRPIFQRDPSELPSSAVIVHVLKLSYLSGNELKDFFVALDSKDIRVLQDVLERAVQKEQSAVSILDAANVNYLTVD